MVECVAVWLSLLQSVAVCCSLLQSGAVCCSLLQSVAVCCRVMPCVWRLLQSVAVCCSILCRASCTHNHGSFHLVIGILVHMQMKRDLVYVKRDLCIWKETYYCICEKRLRFVKRRLDSICKKRPVHVWTDLDYADKIRSIDVKRDVCMWKNVHMWKKTFQIWQQHSLRVWLQRTRTHCNKLQHKKRLQPFGGKSATRSCSLQHTATYCDKLHHCNTLQHIATLCNTLQHTATNRMTLQHTHRLQPFNSTSGTHSRSLQHTATHCNTLQRTATHCNTHRLQRFGSTSGTRRPCTPQCWLWQVL